MTLELGGVHPWPAEVPLKLPRLTPARAAWQALWQPPDSRSREVGFGSELRLAKIRLGLLAMLLAGVVLQWLREPEAMASRLALANTAGALACGLALAWLVRRPPLPSWLPFASSAADVTFVTTMLMLAMRFGDPWEALHSPVLYPLYYLGISATALRSDSRVCLLTGALAIAEYGAVVAAASRLAAFGPAPPGDGWGTEAGRLVLLAAATLLSTLTVLRSRRLLHRSTRDGLTGLYNRGFFEVLLEREVLQARRHEESLAVALVDVDHFKRLNDTHGHLGGDEALRRLGWLLADSFRESDVVARYGGEEFALLLPRTELAAAWGLLERVRRRVEEESIPLGRGVRVRITVSIGVALWPHDGTGPEDVLAVADRRLYAAKHAGRNRVMSSNWRPLEELLVPAGRGGAGVSGDRRAPRDRPVLPPLPADGAAYPCTPL